jgi:hypothetical protein
LRDWLLFCSRYGSGFLEGLTDAAKDSPEWNEAADALRTIANDGVVLHNRGVELKFLDMPAKNALPFHPIVEMINGLYAKCYRGVDVATGTRGSGAQEGGQSQKPVGVSGQDGEKDIYLVRDSIWATGYLNERVDRPIIAYLFDQEPRAGIAIMPPVEDTTAADLATAVGLVPLGLRIALKEAYKRFRWQAPAAGEPCLTAPVPATPGSAGVPPAAAGVPPTAPKPAPGGTPAAAAGTAALPNPADAETQPACDPDQPIGAGAQPGAIAQVANTRMPSPQNGAENFYRAAGVRAARRIGVQTDDQVNSADLYSRAGRALFPALGYAIPNEASPVLSEAFLQAAGESAAAETKENLAHAAAKLAAILQIADVDLRAKKLSELLAQWPDITADTLLSIKTESLENIIGTAYAAGLQGDGTSVGNEFNPDQPRDERGRFTAEPESISPHEADQRLAKGFEVENKEGRKIKFGSRLKNYLDRSPDGAKRKSFLNHAVETVRTGNAIPMDDREVYTKVFQGRDGKDKGMVTISASPQGEVFNMYRKDAGKIPDVERRARAGKV